MKTRQFQPLIFLIFCLFAGLNPLAVAADAVSVERNTALQIFLDEANFGPGKIDGRDGEFTRKALERYKKSLGLGSGTKSDYAPPTGANEVDTSRIAPVFLDYTVSPEDVAQVTEVPTERAEQAKLKVLGYKNVLEAVAERFHTDIDFLKELNPGVKVASISAGDVLKVPNVKPFELNAVKTVTAGKGGKKKGAGGKESTEEKAKEAAAEDGAGSIRAEKLSVRVNTKDSALEVREGDKVRAFFPITSGSDSTPAPVGEWKVAGVATMPDFRYDKKMLKEGQRSDDFLLLPPGPNNPVGVVWIRLNKDGIGIHGTDEPDTIGRSSSHGCIRLANWDIVKLATMVQAGTAVTIE